VGSTAYERVITRSRAFVDPGWMPGAEDAPELADLSADHVRLLTAMNDALAQVGEARAALDGAANTRADALRDAFATGKDTSKLKLREPDGTDLEAAIELYEAAAEALEIFIVRANEEVFTRAPVIEERLAHQLMAAEEKRAEARALLAEAERMAGEPQRLHNWLARFTGESKLGPYAFAQMPLPWVGPMPGSADLVFREGEGQVAEIGSDEITPEERLAMLPGTVGVATGPGPGLIEISNAEVDDA
jgi:hypothetical protein